MTTKSASVASLNKGSYVMADGVPSRVTDVQTSRPGKHGHAKVRLTAIGLLDEKKRVLVMPGHDSVDVPIIGKRNAQVLSVSGNTATVMDAETYETFELSIPDDLKFEVKEGVTVLYWTVLDQKVLKQVKVE